MDEGHQSASELILVHSPLVGPFTWMAVADVLRGRGWRVQTPTLSQPGSGAIPYWRVHAQSAVSDLAVAPPDARYVLAAHSGAGPLLPHIGRELGRTIEAYIFVDAGLPDGGMPRMSGAFETLLRDLYARGERFPNWTDEVLQGVVPDAEARARLLRDLRPQPFEFWEEVIPAVEGWPDAPCAYLQFSPSYDDDAGQARRLGWPVRQIPAGHFHMLVDPEAVAAAILDLLDQLWMKQEKTS